MLLISSGSVSKRSTTRLFVRHKVLPTRWFSHCINLIIVFNIATMAAVDYRALARNEPNSHNTILALLELVWLLLFTAEMVLKLYALQVDAYFEDAWNRLDCALVLVGWLDVAPVEIVNLTALRLSRGLRALRMMSHNQQMKALLSAIFQAATKSLQVLMLLTFMSCVFAIIGLQVFGGITRQRCVDAAHAANASVAMAESDAFVRLDEVCGDILGGGDSARCEGNQTCVMGTDTPAGGSTRSTRSATP